jgi:hypothetical protein
MAANCVLRAANSVLTLANCLAVDIFAFFGGSSLGLYEPLRNDGTNPTLSMGGCAILNTSTSHFKPQANLRNIVAEDALRPANVRIIRVWNELLPLHEHHCSTIDCTHWSRTISQRLGDAVLNAISIHCPRPRSTTQS